MARLPGSKLRNAIAGQPLTPDQMKVLPGAKLPTSLPPNVQSAITGGTPTTGPTPYQIKAPNVQPAVPGTGGGSMNHTMMPPDPNDPYVNTLPADPPTNPLVEGYNQTLPPATSLQEGGNTNPLATDTMGSKLVERLQGAKTTQQEETANRLSALGIKGGQAGSALAKSDRDFGLGMSQGLGQFNINRLTQASNINRDFLQLELAQQLGLGNLNLSAQQLDAQIALKLAELAQTADLTTRNQITDLMRTYFGSDVDSGSITVTGGDG